MMRFRTGSSEAAAGRAADLLCLAAAPAFAAMAILTEGGDTICTAMPGMSALSGMSVMYLLMSAFHLAPWLKRTARLRRLAPTPFTQPCQGE